MKILAVFLLLSLNLVETGAVATPQALQDSFAAVAQKAKPAVVNITAIHEERGYAQTPQFFFGDPEDFLYEFFHGAPSRPQGQPYRRRYRGTGSGAIIDPRGYIITNEHVIRGADEIQIALTEPNGGQKTLSGKVVGKDSNMDLAIVKIEKSGSYPYLSLADSSKIRVGDWAMAIGSPFQLQQTVTVGIISAMRQSLTIEGRRYYNLIQTDAAINSGNSGGPLLNIDGDLMGINTAIFSPSGAFAGIGFAIAINEAKDFIEPLLAGKARRYGWLGVELLPLDAVMAAHFGLDQAADSAPPAPQVPHSPSAAGAVVNSVIEAGPADRAGLKRGDVILKFNNEPVEFPSDVIRLVARSNPGAAATLEISRAGRRRKISLTLGERPQNIEQMMARSPAPARPVLGDDFRWQGMKLKQELSGVAVEEVDPDSLLYGYLLPGDIIRGINQAPVATMEDFKKAAGLQSVAQGIVFDIIREGEAMYISVQVKP